MIWHFLITQYKKVHFLRCLGHMLYATPGVEWNLWCERRNWLDFNSEIERLTYLLYRNHKNITTNKTGKIIRYCGQKDNNGELRLWENIYDGIAIFLMKNKKWKWLIELFDLEQDLLFRLVCFTSVNNVDSVGNSFTKDRYKASVLKWHFAHLVRKELFLYVEQNYMYEYQSFDFLVEMNHVPVIEWF